MSLSAALVCSPSATGRFSGVRSQIAAPRYTVPNQEMHKLFASLFRLSLYFPLAIALRTFSNQYKLHRTSTYNIEQSQQNLAHTFSTMSLTKYLVPDVMTCFEPVTATWQYIVSDPSTHDAVIIDSVLDFDPATSRISTSSADALLSLIAQHQLTITRIMETHAHADHLTAAKYLQGKLVQSGQAKPPIAIGKRIVQVQNTFAAKYGIPPSELGNVFDHLWEDDEKFNIGELKAQVMHLPGHTPDHVGYKIENNVFVGDSIFNPDVGSARADFPGGSATDLWASTQRLLALPGDFKLYTGHDYPPASREGGEPVPWTTVDEQRSGNKHVKVGSTEAEFVEWRRERDGLLGEPRLLHQALQFNVRGGTLPQGKDRAFLVPIKGSHEVLSLL